MEGCPETAGIAAENFMQAGFENIKLFIGPFEDGLPEIMEMGISPGLVFIDGNHRKEPVLGYFERIASISDDKTVVIIFDDINYSAGNVRRPGMKSGKMKRSPFQSIFSGWVLSFSGRESATTTI